MVYLTFNDEPGGVYQSQVIDVCRFWEDTFNEKVKLIAFVSGRNYFKTRSKLKKMYSNSVVLPMYPGIDNWEKNIFLLRLARALKPKENVIGRGVFATLLARDTMSFNKVCFDARGAYTAEWKEYMQGEAPELAKNMPKLESRAVLESNWRIAVSQKLIDYWKTSFHFMSTYYSLIPCTLSQDVSTQYNIEEADAIRKQLGVADNEVLIVYSGSSAGWQSMNALERILTNAINTNPGIKVLMLCKPNTINHLIKAHPGRVIQKWLPENEVHTYLTAADYGLLIREESVTNEVSSPVKFAEYLAAGLPVIISEHIGDFSAFVQDKNCGSLAKSIDWGTLQRPAVNEKQRIQAIADLYFRKKAYAEQYRKLF